jgi:nicotinate-nucleotide adenylyltransferase
MRGIRVGLVKVGVIGGTFDPPHRGHLAVAQEARTQLKFGRVIFIPAGQPWLKTEMPVSPAEDRFEMVRLAIAPFPYFEISRTEIDRSGPSYTYDTVKELRAGLNREVELFFLLGWDSLSQLPRWHEATRLVQMCRLVAVPRPGYGRPDLDELEKAIPGITSRVTMLDIPEINISATEIRQRVTGGLSTADLVPAAVERYISEHGLYRARHPDS